LHGHFGAALPGIGGLVFGLAIIAVVMLLPNGIYWAVRDLASVLLKRADVVSGDADPAPAYAEGAASHVTPANAETRETEMTLRDVSVSFGGVQALQSVSFDIKRAEILGIIGPNGAGKTTLFNVVSGLVRPSSGEIVVGKGVSLIGRSPEQICAAGIGRTFQTVRVFRRLSLLENVVVGAFVQVKDDRAALEKARQVLTRVGLGDRMGALGGSLNNLELRLMEFARTLAGSPKIVLLDECFAGLSGDDIGQIMALLRKLRDEGLTIVIIEHTMDAMAKLVDRMIVMNYGKVLAEGQPKDVLGNQEVITAYLGKRWAEHAEN
jgi:branched-chain amino acid transport system permease protein